MKATVKEMIERERAASPKPPATRSVETMTNAADGPRSMAFHYKVAKDRLNDRLKRTVT